MKTGANNFLKTQLFQLKIAFFSKKLSHHHQLHFLQSIISFVMFHPASQSFLLQFILMYVYVSSYFLQLIAQLIYFIYHTVELIYIATFIIFGVALIFHSSFTFTFRQSSKKVARKQGCHKEIWRFFKSVTTVMSQK